MGKEREVLVAGNADLRREVEEGEAEDACLRAGETGGEVLEEGENVGRVAGLVVGDTKAGRLERVGEDAGCGGVALKVGPCEVAEDCAGGRDELERDARIDLWIQDDEDVELTVDT